VDTYLYPHLSLLTPGNGQRLKECLEDARDDWLTRVQGKQSRDDEYLDDFRGPSSFRYNSCGYLALPSSDEYLDDFRGPRSSGGSFSPTSPA
jgi:hypothetical protein